MNEDILKRLDLIAAKLGVTVQYLWGVLVRQARVEALSDTIGIILWAASAFAAFHYAVALGRKAESDGSDGLGFASIILAVIGVVFVISFVVCVSEIFTPLMNPEFFALEQILKAVK